MRLALWLLLAFLAPGLARAADLVVTVRTAQGRPVQDAVVMIAARPTGPIRFAWPYRMAQHNMQFDPFVLVVPVGAEVAFPNLDNVRHHVYSFSPAKRFELPLYAGVPSQPVMFDRPGIVVLGCNIHDWMVGYVYVSDSPYFAKTGKDGKALLTDLPPRAYVVRVWHPQLEGSEDATKKNVDASRSRSVEVSWTVKLKPEARIRRAPVADRSGRY